MKSLINPMFYRTIRYIVITLFLSPIFGTLTAAPPTIDQKITILEQITRPLEVDRVQLGNLKMLKGDHLGAATLFEKLFLDYKLSSYLFNAAICYTAFGDPKGSILWGQYFRIPKQNREGQRWDELATMIYRVGGNGKIDDEEKFISTHLRSLYLGKGYPLVIVLVDIFNKYGSESNKKNIKRIKGDSLYYSGYPKEALEYFESHYYRSFEENSNNLIRTNAVVTNSYLDVNDSIHLATARCAYRSELYATAWKYLFKTTFEQNRTVSWYHLAAKTAQELGFQEDAKRYISLAGNSIQ